GHGGAARVDRGEDGRAAPRLRGTGMRMDGKVALVTGAASGFGEGIARRFAAAGATGVVADLNEAGGRRVAGELAAAGGRASFVRADVSRGDDVAAMVAHALESHGGLDVLVNNAGWGYANRSSLEVSEAEFDKVFAVNVKSLYHTTVHAVPA